MLRTPASHRTGASNWQFIDGVGGNQLAKKSGRVTRKGRGKVHVSWTAGETRGASLLAAGNYATIFYPSDSALLIINFNIFGVAGAFVAEEQFVDPVSLHI